MIRLLEKLHAGSIAFSIAAEVPGLANRRTKREHVARDPVGDSIFI